MNKDEYEQIKKDIQKLIPQLKDHHFRYREDALEIIGGTIFSHTLLILLDKYWLYIDDWLGHPNMDRTPFIRIHGMRKKEE